MKTPKNYAASSRNAVVLACQLMHFKMRGESYGAVEETLLNAALKKSGKTEDEIIGMVSSAKRLRISFRQLVDYLASEKDEAGGFHEFVKDHERPFERRKKVTLGSLVPQEEQGSAEVSSIISTDTEEETSPSEEPQKEAPQEESDGEL